MTVQGARGTVARRRGGAAAVALAALAAAPLGARGAGPLRVNGSGSALDLLVPLAAAYGQARPQARFEVEAPLGSAGAVQALLAGELDLAILSRPLSPEEAARGAVERPYGRVPLVLVTHTAVPVKHLTTAELEALWGGARSAWPDGEAVRVILRPARETKTRVLVGLSPGMARADAAARERPWAIVAVTDPESDERVAATPGALGMASLTSIAARFRPLNALSLDGTEGTVQALAEGRYRLASEVVFVTTTRASPEARAFLEFVWSPQGRSVAARAGVLVEAPAGPPP